ncbi:MAG: lipoprotein-releasing system permease protein [Planctomycetota bacterium]
MYQLFLSWRYLTRRRVNSIGVMGITVGVGALIMILSIMTGFLEESRNTVRGSLSDVVIQPSDLPRPDGTSLPRSSDGLLSALNEDPRVEAACARLSWGGILLRTGWEARESEFRLKSPQSANLAFAQIVGVDVADEFNATELRENLEREGEYRIPVDNVEDPFAVPSSHEENEFYAWVVVGEQLATVHDLYKGSLINLVTVIPDPSKDELEPSSRKFRVAGTFRSGENEIDVARIYMDRWELSDFLSDSREFTQVLVKLKDYDRDRATIEDSLSVTLSEAGLLSGTHFPEVRTWEAFRGPLLGAIENERALMGIMLALIVLVAAFTVFAILMMMVTEKRRDIGILAALGATPRAVMSIFFLIGMWNALLGSVFGAILGVLGAIKIDAIERWLSDTLGVQIFNREVYVFDHIPSVVTPMAVMMIVAGALLATAIFSLVPAWSASRLHPIDALRAE